MTVGFSLLSRHSREGKPELIEPSFKMAICWPKRHLPAIERESASAAGFGLPRKFVYSEVCSLVPAGLLRCVRLQILQGFAGFLFFTEELFV